MHNEQIFSAVVFVYCQKTGHMLSVSRKDTGRVSSVGGKIEKNESPEQTACREMFEETGLCITERELLPVRTGIDEHGHITRSFLLFYNLDSHGLPETREKGVNVSWVTENDMVSEDLSEFPTFNRIHISTAKILYQEYFKTLGINNSTEVSYENHFKV